MLCLPLLNWRDEFFKLVVLTRYEQSASAYSNLARARTGSGLMCFIRLVLLQIFLEDKMRSC
jgi:hypothetical protein